MNDPQRVRLYLSTEHPCGYLAGREARNAYLDPDFAMNATRYGWMLAQGFRRSGMHVYRPHCQVCDACKPARLPVAEFGISRNQRRCLSRNQDVRISIVRDLTEEHFILYRRYLAARHAGGGMDNSNREAFHAFLECAWGEAQFWEFRDTRRLLALAVVDRVPRALSAVYTFFDPDQASRSLGTLAILKQIEVAAAHQLEHLYLGYWVPGSRKMDYKQNFRPMEILGARGWERFN